jgi:hypothetical protein
MASSAKLNAHDAADDGRKDHGEERADVDQQEDFAQTPRQYQGNEDAEGEEDVTAYGAAGLVGLSGR